MYVKGLIQVKSEEIKDISASKSARRDLEDHLQEKAPKLEGVGVLTSE